MPSSDRTVALSGFLATGKTTLGPVLAAHLGLPFVDTDAAIEQRTGERVPDLWRAKGEAYFRSLEEELVLDLLRDGIPRVLALGGGTVTARTLRHRLLEEAWLVTLTATPAAILARAGDLSTRPTLMGPDPLKRVEALLEQRAAAYAECHLTVDTGQRSAAEVAALVAREVARTRLIVPLGERSYGVTLVNDAPRELARVVELTNPSSLVVVVDDQVRAARGGALDAGLPADLRRIDVTLEAGEVHKTLASVQRIWDAALTARVDRRALVVAFGGGVVCDLAGFAASTLLRGVRVVQVPTTLLAMVDASVGGKTGFDDPLGKNLIGSFHQPTAVVVDFAHLSTLPRRDFRAGLAEVAKIALACDPELWSELERHADALRGGEVTVLEPIARRAIELKIRLVRNDERESGERAVLNLGHTIGHALETAGGYEQYRHGEAVAVGLVLEARAAERLGTLTPGVTERVRDLVQRLGLPIGASAADLTQAWGYVASDKKRAGGLLTLPLLTGIGSTTLRSVPLPALAPEFHPDGLPG